jgi:hypothetical protein
MATTIGDDALRALKADDVDVAALVGRAETPVILDALRDPSLKLLSLVRSDAYQRPFPFVTRLTLPRGTIDLARDIPDHEIEMIGTKAMLVAREGLHPALVNLLTDAAHEIHAGQGFSNRLASSLRPSPGICGCLAKPISTDASVPITCTDICPSGLLARAAASSSSIAS